MSMRNVLALIGVVALLVGATAAAYFFGGYYSVAATAHEPAIVRWALIKVRTASVHRNANGTPPATQDTPAMIRAGARAYADRGCINCHGAGRTESAGAEL
jgi:mono/diheme cytochrome c family protein